MTSANLSDIFSNIYGEESTQSFTNVQINTTKPVGEVLYLDEQPIKYSAKPSLKGGSSAPIIKRSNDDYSDPLNAAMSGKFPDLLKFMNSCYIYFLFQNIFQGGIVFVPSSKTLAKMASEIEEFFEKEGITKHTVKAKKALTNHSFSFKNQLFTMSDRNATDEFPDKIPDEYPDNFDQKMIIRRMNVNGGIMYLEIGPKDSIKVSATKDMKNSVTMKFVTKCDRNVFIFSGDIPESTETIKRSKEIVTAMTGGGSPYKNKINYFRKLLQKHNYDADNAAYDYIGHTVLSENECEGCNGIKKIAKHYSGDFITSAFEIMFDDTVMSPLDMIYDNEDIDDVHTDLVEEYSPSDTKVNVNKGREYIKKIYKDVCKSSKNGYELNKQFINKLKSIYKNYSFKVDLATSIMKKGHSNRSFEEAIYTTESIDNLEDDKSFINETFDDDDDGHNTLFMKSIYNNLYQTPFISIVAKENVPLLQARRKRKNKIIKKQQIEDIPETNETDEDFMDMFN